jgi:hypothetical protein
MNKGESRNKNDLLTCEFRKRLGDYELPVGENAWEKIESDLSNIKKPAKPVKVWLRISAVAAVAVVLLFVGIHYFPDNKENVVERTKLEKTRPIRIIVPEKSAFGLYAENRPQKPVKKIKSLPEKKEVSIPPESETIPEAQEELPTKANESHPQPIQNFNAQPISNETELCENLKRAKKKQKISFALVYGGKGISSSASGNPLEKMDAAPYSQDFLVVNHSAVLEDYEYTKLNAANPVVSKTSYKIPVSVGLLIQKSLRNNWAVETGLTYTYLESTETLKYPSTGVYSSQDIGLHYIGIPLKLIYSFYNNNRFSAYASAGGMAEKTIYGETFNSIDGKHNYLAVPELQWSASGSIGLNYKLIDHFHLFAEPGVSYYFDDKSVIKTIRDDKPFNFNLQLGIRLNY